MKDFVVEFGDTIFPCVDKGFNKIEKVDVVIRPEDVEIFPVEEGNYRE